VYFTLLGVICEASSIITTVNNIRIIFSDHTTNSKIFVVVVVLVVVTLRTWVKYHNLAA
jgi:hypothetical protein